MKIGPFTIERSIAKSGRRVGTIAAGEVIPDKISKAISLYSGVNATLSDTIGAKVPPNNPYELAVLLRSNGYHSRAVRLKCAATVGQGYSASDALRARIDRPNRDYNFQTLLRKWCFDKLLHGNAYTNIVADGEETAFWHLEALKMRVKQSQPHEKTFVHYNYDVSSGYMGYVEYPEFEEECTGEGVRQFKGFSETGNFWYGDPDYLSIEDLLRVGYNITQSALLFYKRGLQSDTAVIVKGADLGPEEEESIRQVFNQGFVGLKNARKVLLLQIGQNEEIKFEKLSASLQDEGTSNIRKDNREEIASAHGIPPRLLGIVAAGSIGGAGEAEAQLTIFKELWADDHQRECEEWWQDLFEDLGFPDASSFKLNPMRVLDRSTEITDLGTATQTGLITPEQAQAAGSEWLASKSIKLIKNLRELSQSLDY